MGLWCFSSPRGIIDKPRQMPLYGVPVIVQSGVERLTRNSELRSPEKRASCQIE